MIRVSLKAHPLDPHKSVSNLLARVMRELAAEQKSSTVIEVDCGPDVKPLRLQLRVLSPKSPKGASRREPPTMTRKS